MTTAQKFSSAIDILWDAVDRQVTLDIEYPNLYNKVLKQLKAELGDQIKIGKKDLMYRSIFKGAVDKEQGVLLDISNLTIDPTNIKLRFNKGGLVERPTK